MADYIDNGLKRIGITISKPMLAIICIIFGMLVLVFPSLLVWIVGLFLVVQGVLLLADIFEQERPITPMAIPNAVYCSQCGTGNMEEAVYCRNCGKTLEQVKQKKIKAKIDKNKRQT